VADPIIASGHAISATGGNLAPAGDVKTLEIQLVPENLGTVTVKMRLVGDALEDQVEADRQGTLRLLTDSKDALSQSIQASGYKLDAMTLQASSNASSNASGVNGGQAPLGQPQGHNSGFQSSSQGSGSSPGSPQQGQDRSRDQAHFGRSGEGRSGETSDGYAQENDRDRRSRSIYV
jgi:chemotaxis protein MotD